MNFVYLLRPRAFTFFLAIGLLAACKEQPAHLMITPQPIISNNQLRFSSGHPQLALLQTTPAVVGQDLVVELPAKLVWNEEKTQRIYPAFSGRVTQIKADVGQSISLGSVLAQIASPEFGMAQAEAAKAKSVYELTQKNARRQQELLEAGIVARKDWEQAMSDADAAAAEWQRAMARTNLYGSGADVNQVLNLTSTISGVVVERNLNPGQEVRADMSGPGIPPLYVVTDPTQLWALIDAREIDLSALTPKTQVELMVASLPNQTFSAQIITSADAIDANTRTIKVRANVQNTKKLLKGEMLATARFFRPMGASVIIPASAVFLRGASNYVFIQTAAGVFEPRNIKLLYEGPKVVYVSEGLKVGDLVVTQNGLLLERELRNAMEEAQQSPLIQPKAKP
jgi:cobalt-zinc-cadmium efflux system membrane fusion protein